MYWCLLGKDKNISVSWSWTWGRDKHRFPNSIILSSCLTGIYAIVSPKNISQAAHLCLPSLTDAQNVLKGILRNQCGEAIFFWTHLICVKLFQQSCQAPPVPGHCARRLCLISWATYCRCLWHLKPNCSVHFVHLRCLTKIYTLNQQKPKVFNTISSLNMV